jgi:hypothetical protein
MEAIFFICALAGVLGIMHWAVTNDAAGNRGPTKGFFAMRDFVAEAKDAEEGDKSGQFRKRR